MLVALVDTGSAADLPFPAKPGDAPGFSFYCMAVGGLSQIRLYPACRKA
jgi:hypothetical protein